MWFSRKAVFRHGRLERISRDFYADNTHSPIVRFKVDGEFFFTSLLQFEASDELSGQLNATETDCEVFLGAHQLDDGTFWLHWLKAPGEIELVPAPPESANAKAWDKMLSWGCAAVLGVIIGIAVAFGGGTGGAAATGVFILVGGVICGIVAIDSAIAVLNNTSALNKTIYQGLESLNEALANGRTWDVPGLGPLTASNRPPPTELPAGVRLCRIDQAEVSQTTIRRSTGKGSASIEYLVYDFMCDGESVSWPVRDTAYDSANTPVFRRRHPPFLAKGDQVILYCADGANGLTGFMNKLGLPSLKFKPVLELFNLTDRTAYGSETDHRGSLPLLYIGAGLLIAFMMVMCGIISLLQNSEPWFFPAVVEILGFLAFAACAGILTMGVVLLLMELVLAVSDNDPEASAGRKRWRETVAALGGQTFGFHPSSPLWMRIVELRIWLLLSLMAVAGFCLSLWF